MTPRAWFAFNLATDKSEAEILIFGSIGQSYYDDSAVSAKDFIKALSELPAETKTIRVRVNSPGGSVFDGIAIANALRAESAKGRTVETVVEGLAASIASVVIMAGTSTRIADNALVMVHNPYTIEMGNAAAMRKMADTLDRLRDSIVATYQWRSELTAEELVALMDAETWMDADEAIAKGFATDKVEGLKAAASIDPAAVTALVVPDRFRAAFDALLAKPAANAGVTDPAPVPATALEILAACRAADCLDLADSLIADGAPLADVQSRVEAERVRRSEEAAAAAARQGEATARESSITALCATAKLTALAAGYIKGGMSVDDVRAHLTTITSVVDTATIDTALDPNHGTVPVAATWKNAFAKVNAGARR